MSKQKGGKLRVFPPKAGQPWADIFSIATFLWIAGIFLLPNTAVLAAALSNESVLAGINTERQKIELPVLKEDARLDEAARQKAAAIFKTQVFAHNIDDKKFSTWIKESGYSYRVVGENLAINFTDTGPLFNAWLASPMHKQNILHQEYTDIGISVLDGNWQGEQITIVVTEFGAPAPLATTGAATLLLQSTFTGSREQFVPTTAGVISPSDSAVASPLLTSNLEENYLQSITSPGFSIRHEAVPSLNVDPGNGKNKTALLNYFNLAVSVMVAYICLMLAIVSVYFYSRSLSVFFKKLHLLNQKQYSR